MGRLEGKFFVVFFGLQVFMREITLILAYTHYTKQKQSNYSAVKTLTSGYGNVRVPVNDSVLGDKYKQKNKSSTMHDGTRK